MEDLKAIFTLPIPTDLQDFLQKPGKKVNELRNFVVAEFFYLEFFAFKTISTQNIFLTSSMLSFFPSFLDYMSFDEISLRY